MSRRPARPPEEVFSFGCEGETLLGLLHHPAQDAPAIAAETGVVVVVGGPQYRAGSHRQFVHLGRTLAAAGYPVLRFDVRGMGDSSGALRSFEQIGPDLGAAVDAMQQRCASVRRVVLWGLCDGASAALLYLHERVDPRVQGVCLANPWVRAELTQARMQVKHYYWRRLAQPTFWSKLLRGQIGASALCGLGRALATSAQRAPAAPALANYQARMLAGWQRAPVPTLLLLSGEDYTAREFAELASIDPGWRAALRAARVQRHDMPGVDHTFSSAEQRQRVAGLTCAWLNTANQPKMTGRA